MDKPEMEACPICGFAEGVIKNGKVSDGCSFFRRCRNLKFGSNELRSKAFRDMHADVCGVCFLPVEECRTKRLQAVRRQLKKDVANGERVDTFANPEELKKLIGLQECSPPKRNYTPVKPEWYTEKDS